MGAVDTSSEQALRVLSLHPLPDSLLVDGRHHPMVRLCSQADAVDAIARLQPNVLIAGAERLAEPTLAAFLQANRSRWARIVTQDTLGAHAVAAGTSSRKLAQQLPLGTEAEQEHALQSIERAFAKEAVFSAASKLVASQMGTSTRARRVLLVGSGIGNLMTALQLVLRGHEVTMIERTPAPGEQADWRAYGCTHGGQDARMYTVTEFDNYNEKGRSIYSDMSHVFVRPLSEGGWLALEPDCRGTEEEDWNEMFQRVPAWLARGYTKEIYEVGLAAHRQWDELFARHPELRQDVGFRDGILRTYDDAEKFESSCALQAQLGKLRRTLSPDQVKASYPIFAAACDQGAIFGALEIEGFTVQLHAFAAKLIDVLQRRSVRFVWNCPALRFRRDQDGCITGLDTAQGPMTADHYVVSPGVDGAQLLQGFGSRSLLHGVVGGWMTLPRLHDNLSRSVKVKRAGKLNEDANVTVATSRSGEPLLILGSGYGYVGSQSEKLSPDQLALMQRDIGNMAASYFPEEYAAAQRSGMSVDSLSFCVRPWTPTGLGVFEMQAADRGLVVVTGGHNTGGFAVSPVVASAVCSALEGEAVDMHWQFNPPRLAAAVPALGRLLHACCGQGQMGRRLP